MAISDKIQKLNDDLLAAYNKINEKGGTVPTDKNSENLVAAINSIPSIPEYEGLKFTAQEDNSTVKYIVSGSLPNINIQYSYSGNEWHDWDGSTISLMSDEKVYVRNTANTLSTSVLPITGGNFKFTMTGKIAASGDISSMINFAELSNYCYVNMFNGCTSLTQAPELPATTLAANCYTSMFNGCTSLTKAPELHATTLTNGCYQSMFNGCTSLTQAPELPATTLAAYCYSNMFKNCTSLTKTPELSATTLASSCYYEMFSGCTSLTQASKLPATTLEVACYSSMFEYCTSLKVQEKRYDWGSDTKIFTCPAGAVSTNSVDRMFSNTGGTFTGTPAEGKTYLWYE